MRCRHHERNNKNQTSKCEMTQLHRVFVFVCRIISQWHQFCLVRTSTYRCVCWRIYYYTFIRYAIFGAHYNAKVTRAAPTSGVYHENDCGRCTEKNERVKWRFYCCGSSPNANSLENLWCVRVSWFFARFIWNFFFNLSQPGKKQSYGGRWVEREEKEGKK